MEKTDRNIQPTAPSPGAVALEPPGSTPFLENDPVQPLTGRAGALAAVERLYQDHGHELKKLADA
jgi:hypothetical protein